jgi:O-methyltransferase
MTETTDRPPTEFLQAAEHADAEQGASSSDEPVHPYHILKERYLTLVESALAGTIYEDAPLRASGAESYDPRLREYGWDWPSKAFTMIGLKRLRNFRAVIESVIGTDVPGDIMETGAWRGGAGIMARAVLAAYSIGDRRVILADSFAGLPPPDPDNYPADAGSDFHKYPELAVPLDEVKRNFAKFGLLDEQVVFLPGWYKDTLPTAPVDRLAVLRLDSDMYESTIQTLDNLYDKVSINGWIVIDDFEVVPACRSAVHDFLKSRDLRPELYPIDGVGVFFRKSDARDSATENATLQAYERARAATPSAFTPMNVDLVPWREALMAVVRASEAVVLANQNAYAAQQAAAVAEQAAAVARREAAVARQEAAVARQEAAVAQQEAAVARQDAARVRRDLGVVYASRSWRLGRPYRAFGAALERLRAGGRTAPRDTHLMGRGPAPKSPRQSPPVIQPRAEGDPWSRWPIWLADDKFQTERFAFSMSLDQFDIITRDGTVALLKDRGFVEIYRDLLRELRPQRIFEIGFFQGGMPLFLADMLAPERVVGIDFQQPSDALRNMIADAGWQDTVKLYGGILQDNTPALRDIVEAEFADRPLDLIIDDASHEYQNSKSCFQELFGYLRPGGKYVIQDWGWLHWPGEEWQTAKSHFWNKPAMTNLIFELVMTLGSQHPKIIARVDIISWACVVVTRGQGPTHGERIDLSATRLTSGRQFHRL